MELKLLLSYLRALSQLYQHMHWKSEGTNYYSDHLLYERLYSNIGGEVDSVAEKAIGISDDSEVIEPKEDSEMATKILGKITDGGFKPEDFPKIAIEAEKSLLKLISNLMSKKPSDGVQNMLQGVADKHETHLYLLQQRNKKASIINSLSKIANKLDGDGKYELADQIDSVIRVVSHKDFDFPEAYIINEKNKREREDKRPQLQIEDLDMWEEELDEDEAKSDRGVIEIPMACKGEIIKNLSKIAYVLDGRGKYSEADAIDKMVKSLAQRIGFKIEEIMDLADKLDKSGNVIEANQIDEIIKTI